MLFISNSKSCITIYRHRQHDAFGNCIAIECLDGKMEVIDNPIGILTNDPPLKDHIASLSKYNHLSAENAPAVTINGVQIQPLIEGEGMVGLPGDWSSPSRFIRLATMIRSANQVTGALERVNFALHLINAIDRPLGVTKIPLFGDLVNLVETVRWFVIKDLTNRVLYYGSYSDWTLRAVDLSKLLKSSSQRFQPLDVDTDRQTVVDMTDKLLG